MCIRTWHVAEGMRGGATGGDAGGGARACMCVWAPLVASGRNPGGGLRVSGGVCVCCSTCRAVEALLVEQEGIMLVSMSWCQQCARDVTCHA